MRKIPQPLSFAKLHQPNTQAHIADWWARAHSGDSGTLRYWSRFDKDLDALAKSKAPVADSIALLDQALIRLHYFLTALHRVAYVHLLINPNHNTHPFKFEIIDYLKWFNLPAPFGDLDRHIWTPTMHGWLDRIEKAQSACRYTCDRLGLPHYLLTLYSMRKIVSPLPFCTVPDRDVVGSAAHTIKRVGATAIGLYWAWGLPTGHPYSPDPGADWWARPQMTDNPEAELPYDKNPPTLVLDGGLPLSLAYEFRYQLSLPNFFATAGFQAIRVMEEPDGRAQRRAWEWLTTKLWNPLYTKPLEMAKTIGILTGVEPENLTRRARYTPPAA